jgi:hypothetical protein
MQGRRRRNPAEGFSHRTAAVKRLTTSFDDATFAEIRELAVAQKTSAADQVRQLVEFGLETLKRAKEAQAGV